MRARRLLVGALTAWLVIVLCITWHLGAPDDDALLDDEVLPPAAAGPPPPPPAPPAAPPPPAPPDDVGAAVANATIVATARSRVAAEAARQPEDEEADGAHTALQGAAVELLTSQSECGIQTFTGRTSARASSVYDGGDARLAAGRHGAALAFDADSATSFHSACGLPNSPWWVSCMRTRRPESGPPTRPR
ncbi:hypothetical protein OAO87_00510 [bacterium]|nr:hypothetical protein [bacterium]